MTKIIGVQIDGVVEWHIPGCGGGDYVTLCGLDGNDPKIGQECVMAPPAGTKINCSVCRTIWENLAALRIRRSDFSMPSHKV